jgi:hypothetical protein
VAQLLQGGCVEALGGPAGHVRAHGWTMQPTVGLPSPASGAAHDTHTPLSLTARAAPGRTRPRPRRPP